MPLPTIPQPIRNLLARLGLEDRECEIYLALLPLKLAKVSAIAKAAKQPRTLTYVVLQKLEEKGIVSRLERGRTLHFIAESPRRLLSYAEERKREAGEVATLLQNVVPQLEHLTHPLIGEPRVSLLHGIDGMKQIYRDALQQEFVGMFNPASMYEAFGNNVVTMLYGKDILLHGRDLLVDSEASKKYMQEVQQHDNYQIRILPEQHKFQTDTLIYGDSIAFISYDDEKSIVRVENQNIADTFRAWFEILWAASRPAKP